MLDRIIQRQGVSFRIDGSVSSVISFCFGDVGHIPMLALSLRFVMERCVCALVMDLMGVLRL